MTENNSIKTATMYLRTPADRSTVSAMYVLESYDENKVLETRVSTSPTTLAESCLREPKIVLDNARLKTLHSVMLDMETGEKYAPVALGDLVRFRRAYLGIVMNTFDAP